MPNLRNNMFAQSNEQIEQIESMGSEMNESMKMSTRSKPRWLKKLYSLKRSHPTEVQKAVKAVKNTDHGKEALLQNTQKFKDKPGADPDLHHLVYEHMRKHNKDLVNTPVRPRAVDNTKNDVLEGNMTSLYDKLKSYGLINMLSPLGELQGRLMHQMSIPTQNLSATEAKRRRDEITSIRTHFNAFLIKAKAEIRKYRTAEGSAHPYRMNKEEYTEQKEKIRERRKEDKLEAKRHGLSLKDYKTWNQKNNRLPPDQRFLVPPAKK